MIGGIFDIVAKCLECEVEASVEIVQISHNSLSVGQNEIMLQLNCRNLPGQPE